MLKSVRLLARLQRTTRRQIVAFAVGSTLALVLVAAGASAALLRPGGSAPQAVPGPSIRDAALVSPETGWILTPNGLQLTQDAGKTWTTITPPNVLPSMIRAGSFYDPLHGWVVTTPATGSATAEPVVYRTINGGRSWVSAAAAAPSGKFTDASIGNAWIDFLSPEEGWVELQATSSINFSFSDLFESQDGGATWSELKAPAAGPIGFLNREDGWLAGGVENQNLFATHDGGESWTSVTPPLPPGIQPGHVAYSLASRSSALALRAETSGSANWTLLFTLTPQDTWQVVETLGGSTAPGTVPVAMPVAVAGSGEVVAARDLGQKSAVTVVGGESKPKTGASLPLGVQTLSFVSPVEGWDLVSVGVCGGFKTDCSNQSTLYATSDGGSNWTRLNR
jgi:photosystem II stability/assembly factor-like uncharacterized protein